jgi:serine/threonine-protein kinase
MSPEQAGADSLVDARSDVYALGCVAYEMLAGEPPFSGATAQAVIARHFHERVPSLRVVRPTTAPATQRVLETAMAKVPADRYSTASEMAQALATSMRGRTNLGRRLALGTVAVAVLAIAAIVWQRARSESSAASARAATALDQRRLAILYFEDASPGKNLSHIAAGLTEDLIDQLSQVRALSVVSPNGVRPFIGKTPPIDSLARALTVGTIVTGSVTRAGRALRLNVRLIDGSTGRQVDNWIVDQSAEDDLTLQERLVAKLTVYLREHIDQAISSSARRSETKSVIAWETLMQSDDLLRRANAAIREQRPQIAVELLQGADSLDVRAARLDPAWVAPIIHRGRVAFTRSYVNTDRGSTDQPPAFWLRRAIVFADDALRLDAHSADALALRGDGRWRLVIQTNDDSLLPLAEADLQGALEARPDLARAWRTLSDLYYLESRFAEAETAARKALDADAFLPNLASVFATLFSASLESERFDEAASWCHRGLQEYPRDRQLMDCELTLLGNSARGGDQVAAAWREITRIEAPDSLRAMEITWGYRRTLVAAVLARTGLNDSARAVLHRMRAQSSEHPRSVDVALNEAYVYALLGDRDEAIRLLTRGIRSNLERTYVVRSARYRSLHDDPRFQALTKTSKSN